MMRISRALAGAAGLAAATISTSALAHPGAGEASGFLHGFAHPVSGLDHILAMVMVGVLAWQLGGRALWVLPATFVIVMALAGGLGVMGIDIPFVEQGIALSVVVLGAMVALGLKAPVPAAMVLVGAFAIFHGHAHGAEMPDNAGGFVYAAGFMLATAILHGVGVGLGQLIGMGGQRYGQSVLRVAGGAAAIAGAAILTGAL